MTQSLTYQQVGAAARGQAHALFAQTVGYAVATAAFLAALGAACYATTRRDLAAIARICFWALLALIVAGLVLVFVHIPGADLVYSVLCLEIFAGFTLFDFQRLRTSQDAASAPFLAAWIFPDVLNVFLFFLEIFCGPQGAER